MSRSKRPSGNCQKCDTWRRSLHRDHIVPKCKGGMDDDSNIQWICANCHEDKTREDLKGRPGPNKGRVFSQDVRSKMSQAAKARKKGLPGWSRGKKLSLEHCAAISQGLRGKKKKNPPLSEEHKNKLSERTAANYEQHHQEVAKAMFPAILDQIRGIVSSGSRATYHACRRIPGYQGVVKDVPHTVVVSHALGKLSVDDLVKDDSPRWLVIYRERNPCPK